MRITANLKSWLVENGVDENADNDALKLAIIDAMSREEGEDGYLSAEKFADLSKDEDAATGNRLLDALEKMTAAQVATAESVKTLSGRIDKIERGEVVPDAESESEVEGKEVETQPKVKLAERIKDVAQIRKAFAAGYAGYDGADAIDADVIPAHKRYRTEKSALRYPEKTDKGKPHPFAGMPAREDDHLIDTGSELDMAIMGAWGRFMTISAIKAAGLNPPASVRMTDHDWELVNHALHNYKFGGVIGGQFEGETPRAVGVNRRKLTKTEIKAIVDDSVSGGLEAAPIVFDDMVISTPLLHSELFNRVTVKNITRGRRIEGVSVNNVTWSWGGGDDDEIDLEDTGSFISAFDTTIFVGDGGIELGLDWMSDSPIDWAATFIEQFGQRLLAELDKVVAIGNGTSEPEGFANASSTVDVNHSSAAPTLGVYESHLFGVPKQYKRGFPTNRIAFFANETSYQRARAIPVGSSDARRLGGMTYEDYMWMGHPYAISADMPNTKVGFANFGRYRMYRRLGLTTTVERGGRELVRRNKLMITARARYGGQLEDGNACSFSDDAQA